MEEKIVTTPIIRGQKYYGLPLELQPTIRVDVYNRARKSWYSVSADIVLNLPDRKRKTDETIRLSYQIPQIKSPTYI